MHPFHRILGLAFVFAFVASCAHAPKTAERAPGSEYPSSEPVTDDSPPHRGAVAETEFDWPVDEARLTRGYFLKPAHGKSKRPHLGIDLAAPRGTPIYASHNGTVIYVGKGFRGFGKMIMIEGKKGFATLYAHLVRARVKEGKVVRQGDLIGDMGRTGRATGVHLHFEIRTASGPVDPLLYLPHSPRFAGLPQPPLEEDAPF